MNRYLYFSWSSEHRPNRFPITDRHIVYPSIRRYATIKKTRIPRRLSSRLHKTHHPKLMLCKHWPFKAVLYTQPNNSRYIDQNGIRTSADDHRFLFYRSRVHITSKREMCTKCIVETNDCIMPVEWCFFCVSFGMKMFFVCLVVDWCKLIICCVLCTSRTGIDMYSVMIQFGRQNNWICRKSGTMLGLGRGWNGPQCTEYGSCRAHLMWK